MDLEESLSSNSEHFKGLRVERNVMTSEEYKRKCNEIQDKIIMGSLINFGLSKRP